MSGSLYFEDYDEVKASFLEVNICQKSVPSFVVF